MTTSKSDNNTAVSDSGLAKQQSVDAAARSDNNSSLQRKVVIRRLPPTMTKDQFLDICSPMPDYEYMYFCNADHR